MAVQMYDMVRGSQFGDSSSSSGNWFSNLFKNSGNSSASSVNAQSMNKSTSNMRQMADAIPNKNVWTALAKASIKATAEYFDSMQQRRQLESQATSYEYQSKAYLMNAEIVDLDLQYAEQDIRFAQNNVYSAYRMGEIQAMEQGLSDAQAIHHERAVTAGSGVRMNSESKMEVKQSNELARDINQWVIQRNTDSSATNAKLSVLNMYQQMSDLELQKANFQAQAVIAQGNADAANIEAKSIKPLMNAGYTFVASMASSMSFGGGQ